MSLILAVLWFLNCVVYSSIGLVNWQAGYKKTAICLWIASLVIFVLCVFHAAVHIA